MNPTIPHELNPLPAGIEHQLANLESRHKRHQRKMDAQAEAKHEARARHRAGWHKRKTIPIQLV
jgi:hypothetical protein